MQTNPESKKPNRTLFYVLGGCVAVFFLCAICLVAALVLAGPQVQQVFKQVQTGLGGEAVSDPILPAPTAAPNTSPRTPTTAASQPNPTTGGNPLDALTKSFRGWGSVKSFRARMSVGGVPAAGQTITFEMVPPDRMHMTTGAQFEMILIGNTSYVKVGPTWQKMSLPQSVDVNMFNPKTYMAELEGIGTTDVKILGPEMLDGVPTIVYQFGATTKGAPPEATTKVWIGAIDGFPHKIEAGGATITFYDFNANITINAPIP